MKQKAKRWFLQGYLSLEYVCPACNVQLFISFFGADRRANTNDIQCVTICAVCSNARTIFSLLIEKFFGFLCVFFLYFNIKYTTFFIDGVWFWRPGRLYNRIKCILPRVYFYHTNSGEHGDRTTYLKKISIEMWYLLLLVVNCCVYISTKYTRFCLVERMTLIRIDAKKCNHKFTMPKKKIRRTDENNNTHTHTYQTNKSRQTNSD